MLAICRRILSDAGEAEDVMTDIFFEVWTKADRFDPTRGSPLTYLMTLSRSRAIDRKRSQASRPKITSDYTDAWFLGFSPSVTCGVWVGYDSRESLGDKETGAKAALPIWMAVMKQAIVGKDDEQFLGDDKPAPALDKAAIASPPKLLKTAAVLKPAASPSPAAIAAKPSPKPKPLSTAPIQPASSAPKQPQVKPALSAQPAPAEPALTVKPALPASPHP